MITFTQAAVSKYNIFITDRDEPSLNQQETSSDPFDRQSKEAGVSALVFVARFRKKVSARKMSSCIS
jgi:hypothetical protein